MTTRHSRLRGLVATLALLAFVVGVPVVLAAIGAVPDLSAFSWSRLRAPDDGALVLEILTIVCWVAWTVFTCQLAVAIISQARGIRAPRLTGLVVPQVAADRLVAAAALLFIAVPSATALLPQPRATGATAATPQPAAPATIHTIGAAVIAEPADTSPAPVLDDDTEAPLERYTVKRGDSLWRIAEDHLGDGTRYVELVELNQTVLNGRPDFLLPGTVLTIPSTEDHPEPDASGSYVVRPGDTLSEIADSELGHADAYPAIVEASRDTIQPDGHRLSDPDLIQPGWRLTIPAGEPGSRAAAPNPKQDVEPPRNHRSPAPTTPAPAPATPAPSIPAPIAPSETADPSAADGAAPDSAGATDASDDRSDPATPSWLAPGLTAAGSVLAGALWLVLRAQRRTQLRHRRPGTVIPPPPPALIPAEKTARATASVIAPRLDALDTALRALPQHLRLLTARMDNDAISLNLREPVDLPAPWSGAATEWRVRLADVPKRTDGSFPPYPLLVSVGRAADGAFVFLNLEELRTVTVAGDPARKVAFARHLAAELALNPWSTVTTVNLLGLGSDLASFNLGRVRTHPAGDTAFITDLARDLSSITEPSQPDDFHAAIIVTTQRPAADLDRLASLIESIPGRSPAALIDLDADQRARGTRLEVTADGRLREPRLGVNVAVAGLSAEEARACALLLDLTLDETMVEVPASDDDATVCDLGGALVEELTQPRAEGPTGAASLLPLDAHEYADAAATTVEDIERLAPRAAPQARTAVATADPDLDEDLARWESSTLSSAKLILLGPVAARTTGDAKATAHRRPFYVELLAYVALHTNGVTGHDIADAFGLRPDRVRVDMSQLRRWLGTDPRTGEPYIPKAEPRSGADSPAVYRVRGVLSDVDLFRRLRARGQSQGAEGIDDLIAALRLVSGEPFTQLREGHWNWLLDDERWDHLMSSAIVDVAHIVTTHALATNDHDLALWAAQVAYGASPYDEVAQLDIIAAEKARGENDQADRDLSEKIFNRRDDDQPPIGLPSRTTQVVQGKGWNTHGTRSRRTG